LTPCRSFFSVIPGRRVAPNPEPMNMDRRRLAAAVCDIREPPVFMGSGQQGSRCRKSGAFSELA
jgi:hypothetical protein